MWHLEEDYRVYCTLVQGKDLAILWDTDRGSRTWRPIWPSGVRTPYLVCNSHGHADHIGGNFRFSASMPTPGGLAAAGAHARMTGQGLHAGAVGGGDVC